jgi:5-methylcytosine-specific restriction protein B
MNTADRSIALVDHALRRRFAFLELRPQYQVLTKFHTDKQTGFPVDKLLVVLDKVKAHIRDPHYFVGISFFIDEHLNDTIESVWRTEIFPYLDEYFFDRGELARQFTWDAVRPQLEL